MKTKEELNALKKEAEMLYNKLNELTDDELRVVVGGADDSYDNMFDGCTSWKTAPELPAQNLSTESYDNMFNGAGNLKQAPEFPSPTLK